MVTWKFVLVVFVTGADHIPPMGFENKLTLSFDHDSLYPIASTCLLASSSMKNSKRE